MLDCLIGLARRLIDRIFPSGAITLSLLSLGYFGMGLIRNRLFANTFGAGPELDAYNAAFRIPEIALDILVASGLSAPFIPIFMRLLEGEARRDGGGAAGGGRDGGGTAGGGRHDAGGDDGGGDDGGPAGGCRHDSDPGDRGRDGPEGDSGGKRRAEAFGRTVLTAAVLVMTAAMAALFVAAPWLAANVFNDFEPSTQALYVELLRINCLAQILFAASITLGEVLIANRRFLFYALAPILYSAGIVLGTLFLGPTMGIHGSAYGALAGAAAHLGMRAFGVARTGFRIAPDFRIRTAEFAEFVRLMVPRMLSYPIDPIVVFFITLVATRQGPGNASALSFVLDYQFVPVQVFAITFSLAIFPTLSAAYAEGDGGRFRALLVRNVATIGVLTAAAALVLAVGSGLVIRVFLGGGRFDEADVALTAGLLAAFAISIPIDSLSYPLSRALYATHNTVYQVLASLANLATLVVVAEVLLPTLGVYAIPVGYAAGGLVKIVVLTVFLIPRVRRIGRDGSAVSA